MGIYHKLADILWDLRHRFDYEPSPTLEWPAVEFQSDGRFKGNCTTFAMACRAAVLEQTSARDVRLVTCITSPDAVVEHAVCLVNDGPDQWILDNRQTSPVSPEELVQEGYAFLKVSHPSANGEWFDIV